MKFFFDVFFNDAHHTEIAQRVEVIDMGGRTKRQIIQAMKESFAEQKDCNPEHIDVIDA